MTSWIFSKSLGIQKAVLPHANSILDAAKSNNWPAIRKEFDLTQKTVRETIDKNRTTTSPNA